MEGQPDSDCLKGSDKWDLMLGNVSLDEEGDTSWSSVHAIRTRQRVVVAKAPNWMAWAVKESFLEAYSPRAIPRNK